MWLPPRQPRQLWSHALHGRRQERTRVCGQDAAGEAPGPGGGV